MSESAATRCHCGRTVERRDPDPWEGRMDGYCYECATNRCDCYPDECPVKYPPERSAATSLPLGAEKCVPLCGATKAYGRFVKWWQHDSRCPAYQAQTRTPLPEPKR